MDEKNPNFASGGGGQSNFDRELEQVLPFLLGIAVVALLIFLFFSTLILSVVLALVVLLLHKEKYLTYAGIIGLLGLVASFVFHDFRPLFQFPAVFQAIIPLDWYVNLINSGEVLIITPWSYFQAFLLALPLSWVWALLTRKFLENRLTLEKERKKKKALANSKIVHDDNARQKRLLHVQRAFRKKQQTSDILLGINIQGKPVFVPYNAMFKHCLIQGTTGSGKTYTMYSILETALRNGLASIFIDGKGDPKTERQIRDLAKLYGKNVTVFSDRSGLHYNPVKYGKATAIKDRLMSVMDWSESFYEKESANMLQMIIAFVQDYIEIEKNHAPRPQQGRSLKMDLATIHRFLDLSELANYLFYEQIDTTQEPDAKNKFGDLPVEKKRIERASPHKKYLTAFFKKDVLTRDDLEKITSDTNAQNKLIRGLRTQLELLLYSDLGEQFNESDQPNENIELQHALLKGDIVLFSFNSNDYGSFIEGLGRFVIADVAHMVTQLYSQDNDFKGAYGFFDEFGSYGNEKILDILAKARSANFGAILGIQSIADLNTKYQDLTEIVVDNVNTFLFGRSNSPKSAETIAGLIGTYEDIDRTTVTEDKGGLFARIETKEKRGTVRNVRKYIFAPDEIKDLEDYTFFVVEKQGKGTETKQKVYARNVFEGLS